MNYFRKTWKVSTVVWEDFEYCGWGYVGKTRERLWILKNFGTDRV
jgi:hypothetical protein